MTYIGGFKMIQNTKEHIQKVHEINNGTSLDSLYDNFIKAAIKRKEYE